jgi:putative addiction module component (TIGR02574 family)
MNTQLSEILQLSVPERLQLVEAIWDSIAVQPEALSLTESQRIELDLRLDDYQANPNDDLSWDEVRNNLLQKK